MGDVFYLEGSPENWMWIRKPKANVSGAGPARTDDLSNPTGFVFKLGSYKRGETTLATPADGDLNPWCFDGHELATLPPAKMTKLILSADRVGRDWITIPE